MQDNAGLYSLIEQDPEAKRYYDSLPDHIRDQISQNAAGITSETSLKQTAQQLLQTGY